jgi:hypothetical protein
VDYFGLFENAYATIKRDKSEFENPKKGKGVVWSVVTFYGRFLIISTSITNTMMTNTNRPAIAGTK